VVDEAESRRMKASVKFNFEGAGKDVEVSSRKSPAAFPSMGRSGSVGGFDVTLDLPAANW